MSTRPLLTVAILLNLFGRIANGSPPGTEAKDFVSEEKLAVVVGISAYPAAGPLQPLAYAANDAQSVADSLKEQGYSVNLKKDGEADKDSILKALDQMSLVVKRTTGTVLFFFSGHGRMRDAQNFIYTYAPSGELDAHLLSIDEVVARLEHTGAARRVIFVDACRNVPGKGQPLTFDTLDSPKGTAILYSTGRRDVSFENPESLHGVFTDFLLRGIRGAAAGPDGLVTFDGLSEFVTKGVTRYSFSHNHTQEPWKSTEVTGGGDFVIGALQKTESTSPGVGSGAVRDSPGTDQCSEGCPVAERILDLIFTNRLTEAYDLLADFRKLIQSYPKFAGTFAAWANLGALAEKSLVYQETQPYYAWSGLPPGDYRRLTFEITSQPGRRFYVVVSAYKEKDTWKINSVSPAPAPGT